MKAYAQPLAYSLAAIIGLVLTLLGDGVVDALGLLLLSTPFIPLVRASLPQR